MPKRSDTKERTIEMKDEIYQLYSVEGRSLNHISKVLNLSRRAMTAVIKGQLGYVQANKRLPTERIKNLIAVHKEAIIHFCNTSEDPWFSGFRDQLGLSESEVVTMRANDSHIDEALKSFANKPTIKSFKEEERKVKESKWEEEMKPLEGEVWKEIKGYEGLYWVSTLGRVKNTKKLLAIQFNPKIGRNQIGLYKDGRIKVAKPYRLVAEAFLLNPENLPTVNHKDGDCINDILSNLEWSSYKEQNQHRINVLKRPIAKAYKRNGKFRKVIIDGEYEFKTLVAAAKFLGVSETTIQRYLSGDSKFSREIKLVY